MRNIKNSFDIERLIINNRFPYYQAHFFNNVWRNSLMEIPQASMEGMIWWTVWESLLERPK